ncbi:MAG: zf-HC2 domain-containing protein [Planctomycetota bacterium]|nr:zf-HC2 domain-containing protein [Planctomycetota bacterium]
MGCPHCERIGAFLDGQLAGAERAACEEHILSCRECTLELEYMKRMALLLSVAMQAERQSPHARVTFSGLKQRKLLRWSKGLALAASLLFAVSGFLVLGEGGRAHSSADVAWQQAAVMPQMAMVEVDLVDPVAQKLLGMRP